MFSLMYEGIRWGFAFLKTDGLLTAHQRYYIIEEAISMYLEGVEKREIEDDGVEGMIYTEGKRVCLGSIAGQRYDAEVDTNNGEAHIRFIINEMSRRDHREAGALN